MTIPTRVRDETLLWLTRAFLAAVVWVTLWGVTVLFTGVDESLSKMRVYVERIDSLAELQDGGLRAIRTYADVFENATNRTWDSVLVVRGSDTLPIQNWLELGVTPRIPPIRLERLAVAAAKDSIRLAALELLVLSPADREIVRAGQLALGRERQFWTLLKASLGTAPGSAQRARVVEDMQRSRTDIGLARVAVDTFIAYAQAARHVRSKRITAAADSVRQDGTTFRWRSLLGALAAWLGIMIILVLVTYALTGKWEALPQVLRRRIEPEAASPPIDRGGVRV